MDTAHKFPTPACAAGLQEGRPTEGSSWAISAHLPANIPLIATDILHVFSAMSSAVFTPINVFVGFFSRDA